MVQKSQNYLKVCVVPDYFGADLLFHHWGDGGTARFLVFSFLVAFRGVAGCEKFCAAVHGRILRRLFGTSGH